VLEPFLLTFGRQLRQNLNGQANRNLREGGRVGGVADWQMAKNRVYISKSSMLGWIGETIGRRQEAAK
jgi:hypothetical protein